MLIIYKTSTVHVFYVTGRRVKCDSCAAHFTYLVSGTRSGQSIGLPVISSDRRMSQAAFKRALRSLKPAAGRKRFGVGRCAHCGAYQKWMVRRSRLKLAFWGLLLGAAVGLVTGWAMVHYGVAPVVESFEATLGGAALVGALLGAFLLRMFGLKGGPGGRSGPLSLTDKGLAALLDASRKARRDPVLAWAMSARVELPGNARPVSLGLLDATGEMDFGEFEGKEMHREAMRTGL